ncbi:MAG: RDD family protein [Bryobacteraceae bacterium]
MECRYCQAANADDEHRCRRCGRRLRMSPVYAGSSAAAPVLQTNAAPVLQYSAAPVLQDGAAPVLRNDTAPVMRPEAASGPQRVAVNRTEAHRPPEPSAPRRPITYQPSLFPSRELPLVVQFETIAPDLVQPSPRKQQPSTPRPRRRKPVPGQLEFTSHFTQPARSSKQADGVIYCDAPVAIPAHRAMAAALDASIIVMALALFGIVFHLAGGVFVLNAKTAPMFLGVATGVVIFYRLLWCIANGDTVGQKCTRLRLVNFDGHTPTRAQRFYRTASGFLSLMAGGIGLLWGLVDEETLTWHDHISKTFPTPVN